MDFARIKGRVRKPSNPQLRVLTLAWAVSLPLATAEAQAPAPQPAAAAPAAATPPAPRPIESRITQVTVFRDVAQVTRTAALDLPIGNHTLAFTGLPIRQELDALDCRIEGEARVLALRIEPKSLKAAPDRVKALTERMNTLERELGGIAAEVKVLDEKREFLTGVRAEAPKSLAAGMAAPAAGLRGTLDFLGQEWLAIEKARLDLEARRTELTRQRDRARIELNDLQSPAQGHEVWIDLDATRAGPVSIELSYLVAGASWRPYHDARLDREQKTIEWSSFAEIRQASGEDWNGVALTVSTSNPTARRTIPTLDPIRLGAPPNLDGVGAIHGLLSDARTGQPLPYANVILLGTQLGAITQEDGSYTVRNVPPGTHQLQASYVGHAILKQDLGVSAGSQVRADFSLQAERFTEKEILVSAKSVMVSKERADTHHTISGESFKQVPADDVTEAIALKAGVVAQGGEQHFRGGGGDGAEYGNAQSGLVELGETAIGAVFRMQRQESIPADGSWHRALISAHTLPVELEIVTVPRRDRAAYLRARGANGTEGPLLPGPVHLFSGKDYLGRAELSEMVSPGATIGLSFGRYERIEVDRVLVKEERSSNRRESELSYQYRITVRNFDREAQEVLVLDQVPVAADERVRVELLTLVPAPHAGSPDERGALSWTLGVEPGQEVAIDLAYKVRCPREFGLAGL
jgi:hypothetical protein